MEIKFEINKNKRGTFSLYDQSVKIGETAISISGDVMAIYYTQIIPPEQRKGYAKLLLQATVEYSRTHHLLVLPLCSYTLAKFEANPDEYESIWKKQ